MKKALIDVRVKVVVITGWNTQTKPVTPIYEEIENSARVAEVSDQDFPVADPLFWMNCIDEVVADHWYYDTNLQAILVIPSAPPKPVAEDQPVVSGAQTL